MLVVHLVIRFWRLEDSIAGRHNLTDILGAISVVRSAEFVQPKNISPDLMVRVLVLAKN